MEVWRLLYLFLLQFLYLSSICNCQYETTYKFLSTSDYTRGYKQSYTVGYTGNPMQRNCKVEKQYSGEIYFNSQNDVQQCWKIEVPQNNYVRINLTELRTSLPCHQGNVKISVSGTDEEFMFCGQDTNRKPVIALNDVNITCSKVYYYNLIFKIDYNIENLICTRKEHFRCSNHSCIYQYQVCDGVTDCENGADEKGCETGVAGVSGVNISRENAITWLKNQWSGSSGWGKNTPRAIIALYLAGSTNFNGVNLTGELMANQLELQTSVALLRNSTDPISVSDLNMFINALTITCHNPRQFYGYDLLRILSEQVVALKSPSPAAYLTLCNGNWPFGESHVESLLRILHKHSEYPFHLDVQAMTIMALTCVRNKTKMFENIQNATKLYNSTIQKFIDRQLHDGSFGNVYTTALVTQALLSSGQQNNKLWKINSTVKYLMKELNTSADFLSTYLALPVFNDKSLNDIANVNCSNHRKHGEDDDITDVMNKLGGKVRVQYSLFVGDHKDVIHTMYMSMPAKISAFEVMKLAQVVDQKYKFMHRDVLGHMYVYTIAGITNDPEAGKFWLLYTGDSHINGTVHHHTKSPDKYILADGDHLIMWYKTAHI